MSSERNCKNCDSSWHLPPTGKEIKDGLVESRSICCDLRCAQQLTDGMYPQLAELAVENPKLCGPKRRFWKPIKEIEFPVRSLSEIRTRPKYAEKSDKSYKSYQGDKKGPGVKVRLFKARKPYTV